MGSGSMMLQMLRRTLTNLWHRMLHPRTVDSRLALAIEGANDGLWDWDLRTNAVYYSPRWATTLGYDLLEPDDHVNDWLPRIHPDDMPALSAAMEDHITGRTTHFQAEFRLKDKNGQYRWIFARGISIRDDSGKPIRLAGSMTDVTLRKFTEAALQDSEQRYRSLFEATIEAVLIHKDGKILDVNHAFEHVFGYSRVEAVGMSPLAITAPESYEIVTHCLETDFRGRYEAVAQRKDGSTFPVEVHVKTLDYGGEMVRVTALRDITERVQMVESERKRRELAEALLDASRSVGRTLDLETVLDDMLNNVGRVVPHTAADVMLVAGSDVNVLRTRGDRFDELRDFMHALNFKISELRNLRQVIESRQPVILADTRTDPDWVDIPETRWIRSHLSAPVVVDDEVIALFNLSSDQPDAFTEQDAQNLVLFATGAGFAIKNARLYEAERLAKRDTQTLLTAIRALSSMTELDALLQTILEQAAVVVPYVSGSIGIFDDDGRFEFKALSGWAEDQLPAIRELQESLNESAEFRTMLNRREPILIPDVSQDPDWGGGPLVEHIRSWMGLPLLVGDQVKGILSMGGEQVDIFTPDHMAIAQAFAANAAIALRRVELLEAERLARQRAQALLEANRVLSSTLSLEEVLKNILQQCETVLPYSQGIILADAEGVAPVVATSGYPDESTTVVVDYLKNEFRKSDLFQYIKAHPQPLMMADVQHFDGWAKMPDVDQIAGWMGVPLMARGELVGLLMLCSDTVDAYRESHAEIARAFADQAALAVQNAQLYEAEQSERALAQTLQQTAEALASSLQLDATLKLITQLLGKVVDYNTATVSLIEGSTIRLLTARGLPAAVVAKLKEPQPLRGNRIAQQFMIGRPIMLADASADPGWSVAAEGVDVPRGWIGVPLVAYSSVVGLLTVGSDQVGAYDQRDLEAVMAFASQAAIAIQNSRLMSALEASLYDLRSAQMQLVQSARLSAAGEVSLGVAHQINNPLTIIMAETHLMQRRIAEDSPLRESVDAINEAARQAGTVVQRMLDFSRTRPTDMREVDVNASLQKALLLFRAQLESHISLVTDLDETLPPAYGSEEQLGEVWLNLLLNARDALENAAKGIIAVRSALSFDRRVVEVHFADNGPGIRQADLERIFEPFFTTKATGTGLGLALSKEYITAQGGSLGVVAEEGVGTTFIIRLPLASRRPTSSFEQSAGGQSNGSHNSGRG